MKKMVSLLLMCILLFSSCGNESNYNSSVGSETPIASSQPEISSIISKVDSKENSVSNQENIIELKRQGEIMILPLLRAVGLPCDSIPIRTLVDLEEWEIKNFILLNAFYTDNVDYIYYDYIIHTDQSINSYHYPLDNIQQMVYEVFGISNWDGLRNSNIDWNENDQAYETGLEFEIGRIIETKEISSMYDTETNQIKVGVSLSYYGVEVNGDPNWSYFDKYSVIFEVMSQDTKNYLRFVSAQKEN